MRKSKFFFYFAFFFKRVEHDKYIRIEKHRAHTVNADIYYGEMCLYHTYAYRYVYIYPRYPIIIGKK